MRPQFRKALVAVALTGALIGGGAAIANAATGGSSPSGTSNSGTSNSGISSGVSAYDSSSSFPGDSAPADLNLTQNDSEDCPSMQLGATAARRGSGPFPRSRAGGVAVVTGQLGASVGTSALVDEWQTGEVVAVALTRAASGSTGRAMPFLTGLKNPLPLVTTSTGTLLVGDWATGTIYEIAER